MSTGDQSGYIRAKMAERGTSQASFSRDGFDNWAESTAPARDGQMEKIPAERQMASVGGAMTVRMAKKLSKHHGKKFANSIVPFRGGAMCGGRSFLGIEIPKAVEDAFIQAEKIIGFAKLVAQKLPEMKQALQEEIIDNFDDPSISDKDRQISKSFVTIIDQIKPYVTTIEKVIKYAEDVKGLLGAGNMRGGASAADTLTNIIKQVQTVASAIFKWYSFFKQNANFIPKFLKLRPMQPIGNQILEKLQPIFTVLGVGGRRGGAFGQSIAQGSTYGSSEDDYAYGNNQESRDAFGRLMKQEGVAYAGPSRGAISGPVYTGQNMGGPMGMQKGYEAKALGARVVGGRKCKCKGGAQELYMMPQQMPENEQERERIMEERYKAAEERKRRRNRGGAQGYTITQYSPGMTEEEYNEALRKTEERRKKRTRGGAFENFMSMKEENVAMAPPPRSGPLAKPRGGATKFVPTTSVGKRAGGRKPSARGEIVKKVMREQGLSLPQASKYVKDNGLY